MSIDSNPAPLSKLFLSLCPSTRLWRALCVAVLQLILLVPNTARATENTSPSFKTEGGPDALVTPLTPTKYAKSIWYGEFRYEEEYNDERSFANLFGNKIMGSLGNSSDVDWYSYALPAGTNVKVTFEETNYQPGTWSLSWYSPSMQGLSEQNITTSTRDGVANYTYTFNSGNAAGTYYLRVKPYSSTTFKPDVYFITVDVPHVPKISLVQSEVNIVEGNTNNPIIPVSIQLDSPSAGAVMVHYTVRSGTASVGTPYASDVFGTTSGTLTINPGETTATINKTYVLSDTTPEPNEYLWVDFDSIVIGNAQFALGVSSLSAKVNIIDDDTIAANPLADLIVTSVVAPSNAQAGDTMSVMAFVKNQGATAGPFRINFYISTDSLMSSSDIDLNWGCTISSLDAGETRYCYGDMPTPSSTAGEFYVGAIADAYGQVSESDESNNAGSAVNSTLIGGAGYTAINVEKLGTGSGTVVSSPIGINCGATCSKVYPSGTSVTLSATAHAGSTFVGWGGAGCSGTAVCTVSMSQVQNVTAAFTANSVSSYTLSITELGSGSGAVVSIPSGINCGSICSSFLDSGTSVTLTATAAAGSTFVGWSGDACSGTGTCTVSMSQPRSVAATFTLVSVGIYDGIYEWDAGYYLSVHQIGGGTLVGAIYWVYTANPLQVGARRISESDTFDLLHGQIIGSSAAMTGTRFYRGCSPSYDFTFNSDSSLTVRLNKISNSSGVSTADVDCNARYNSVGSVWTIPRIY